MPEKKSAISQMYWLLFCLTGSLKFKTRRTTKTQHRERRRECMTIDCDTDSVKVCVLIREGNKVLASSSTVVVELW